LKKLGFPIDSEIKSLIVSGDIELIADLLKELYNHFKAKSQLNVPLD